MSLQNVADGVEKKLLGKGAQIKKPKEAKTPTNSRQTERKPPFEYARKQNRWTAEEKQEPWGTNTKPRPAPKTRGGSTAVSAG